MKIKIQPVQSSITFGTSNLLKVWTAGDDLRESAVFNFQFGRAPREGEARIYEEDGFVADPNGSGQVTLKGDAYKAWSGKNEDLPAILLPLLPGGVQLAS